MSGLYAVSPPALSRTCSRCGWAPDTHCECRRTGRPAQRSIQPGYRRPSSTQSTAARTAQPDRSSEPARRRREHLRREHLRLEARLRALMPADPATRLRYLDAKRDWRRRPMTWLEAGRRLEELRRDTPAALRNPPASAPRPRTPATRWCL